MTKKYFLNFNYMNLENKYDILLPTWEVKNLSLREILNNEWKTLLYFYPKDNTPWCTLENKDFSCLKRDFLSIWVNLVWVSKDSLESHKKFISWHWLENALISDKDLVLHKELWAYGDKNNYWKIVLWVIRSTFLVDKNWNILKEWKWVKATWHATRIFEELFNLK